MTIKIDRKKTNFQQQNQWASIEHFCIFHLQHSNDLFHLCNCDREMIKIIQ